MPSNSLHALFLGPNAENQQLFEKLLLEFLRDHAYWRRNFHPEDGNTIPTSAQFHDIFLDMVAKTRRELGALSADLKRAAPFYSPRYIGHMNSDLLIPGLIAQMMTTLYNPNNVSAEAGPATISRELEVGNQLATMCGYNTDPEHSPIAWGHLTSGGTVANYEALFNLREVKFFPLALASATRELGLTLAEVGPEKREINSYSPWELVNFSVSQTIELLKQAYARLKNQGLRHRELSDFWESVNRESLKHLGAVAFFEKHKELKPPIVLAPATAHYSWEKALRLLSLGERQLIKVNTTRNMTMDIDHFEEVLEREMASQRPVLAAIGVLGTTEFSSVDPLADMVVLRDKWLAKGRFFGIHVDAAWGGYLACLFRRTDGSFCAYKEVGSDFKWFPTTAVYRAFRALSAADSITIDPHKLGYLPYPSGAYICRDLGMIDFIVQKVTYLYDIRDERETKNQAVRLKNLGQFILEGSKPGAAAAAAFVCHRVLPLHKHGFGRLVERTVCACEYFRFKLHTLKKKLSDDINLTIPIEPQTNILCFAFNPKKNPFLGLMNPFERRIFANIKIDYKMPLQLKDFIGSYTSLVKHKVHPDLANDILNDLGIDPASFVNHPDNDKQSDHIFLFRHSLMSPWLLEKVDGANYIDRFCDCLENHIREALKSPSYLGLGV